MNDLSHDTAESLDSTLHQAQVTAPSLRLILLDDHPLVLEGLVSMIGAQPGYSVVGRCTSPDALLPLLRREHPDVLISDIKMPGANVFEVVKQAKSECPPLKILFLSGHDDDIYIERAFAAGASGFISKSSSPEDIYAAIQTVAAGGQYISAEIKVKLGVMTDSSANVHTRLSVLTAREREVLQHVSMGMSAREISQELKISTWTVTNHKANIMAKLNIHNQVGLTRFAVSTGIADIGE